MGNLVSPNAQKDIWRGVMNVQPCNSILRNLQCLVLSQSSSHTYPLRHRQLHCVYGDVLFRQTAVGFPHYDRPRTYRNYYHGLMKRLDIPRLKYHGLRHSFATRCIESNCDYKTVSVLLGHANITTTLNLYVHPNMEQKKKCITRMFKSLGK